MTKREKSIVKGAVAGLIGGLAGSGIKLIAERILPPDGPHSAVEREEKLPPEGLHWTFGALAGAAYGALMEHRPSVGAWRGAAFGLTLNKFTHDSLLPRMGLAVPPGQQPAKERVSEWVSHAAYGVVTDTVRRVVRRVL